MSMKLIFPQILTTSDQHHYHFQDAELKLNLVGRFSQGHTESKCWGEEKKIQEIFKFLILNF